MRRFFMLACAITVCGAVMAQDDSTTSKLTNEAAVESVPTETSAQPLDFWMQKKLDYSTAILRGLSMGDFELIETNAERMRLLNKIEGFARSRNEEYRGHVRSFERVTDEVIHQAKKKNIDGVTLAFHQLTVNCVRCHQSLRETE